MMRAFLFLLACSFLFSCRVKVPTVQEGEELIARGAFPSGVPPWIASRRKGASALSYGGIFSGMVPGGGVSEGISSRRTGKRAGELKVGPQGVAEKKKGNEQNLQRQSNQKDSPLVRITQICPGQEEAVTDALTTTNAESRIQKLRRAARNCGASYDLWLWLGQDYYRLNRHQEASQSFERVLMIYPTNEEAQSLLEESRRRIRLQEEATQR